MSSPQATSPYDWQSADTIKLFPWHFLIPFWKIQHHPIIIVFQLERPPADFLEVEF
jgi:hypothetical protein